MRNSTIPVYTEKESFTDNKLPDFYISSYKDDDREVVERIAPHRHTYHEIIWVRHGKGIHNIDFVNYQFQGPCLFLLHPQNIHTIRKETATSGGVIKFTSSIFAADDSEGNFTMKYGVFDDIDVLPVINLKEEEAVVIHQLFKQIYIEYKKESSFGTNILALYLKIFLLKVYEIKKRNVPLHVFNNPEFMRFKNFQMELDKHYVIHHSVGFYSDALHMSGKTLSNTVQKFTGKSPGQLIKERILLEAKRLLYHSDLSVKEIAYKLGFEDNAYFIRFFKKATKISPGAYRKEKEVSFS